MNRIRALLALVLHCVALHATSPSYTNRMHQHPQKITALTGKTVSWRELNKKSLSTIGIGLIIATFACMRFYNAQQQSAEPTDTIKPAAHPSCTLKSASYTQR